MLMQGTKAVLIDSGKKPKVFASCCWNGFLALYADEIDVVVSHVDSDHISGLFYLSNNKVYYTLASSLY